MTAYVDTSALLRVVLREPGSIDDLQGFGRLVSSELLAVESARTINRLRLQGSLTTDEAAFRLQRVGEWVDAVDLVLLRATVLRRAAEPLPTPLGTLDAIHLATALVWRDRVGALPLMVTHDAALATAARAFGFDVRGA